MEHKFQTERATLKSGNWDKWARTQTDQRLKMPMPEQQKPVPEGATLLDLPDPLKTGLGSMPVAEALLRRRSYRGALDDPLSLETLSFLLWATQGISGDSPFRRTAPSGGARHPFETYLYVRMVDGLAEGLYRYLPLSHQLVALPFTDEFERRLSQAANNQPFVSGGAATFIWTAIPYRSEWRYDVLSHKVIALDAGHVCQNLYLAATAVDCGVCGIGAYNQKKIDALIGVDGEDEFVIYMASCCRLPRER